MLECEVSFESSGGGEPPVVRRMEVVSGPGGRRRWTREAKVRIIEETLGPGANVAEVARRHGLVPQQLYAWRSAARARATGGGMSFVPISLEGSGVEGSVPSPSIGPGEIVVQASGMTVHIPAGVSADHIERVLLAVRVSA